MEQVKFVDSDSKELERLESKKEAILEIRQEVGCNDCPRLYQCEQKTESRYRRVHGRIKRNGVRKVL